MTDHQGQIHLHCYCYCQIGLQVTTPLPQQAFGFNFELEIAAYLTNSIKQGRRSKLIHFTTLEQIMQMQDDIHKLKKLMDSVFEKM
ncbi:hypothetical protein Plhal710r2_c014g0062871 [Plasmopara halstedii]